MIAGLNPMGSPMRASNIQLDQQRTAQNEAKDSAMQAVATDNVARFVTALGERCWQEFMDARDHRREITEAMLRDLRMLRREYEPDQLAMIRQDGGSEIFLPLVANKVRLAVALLQTIYINPETPFQGKPTPVAEIPPDIQAALLMQAKSELAMGAPLMMGDPALMMHVIEEKKAKVMQEAQQWAERRAEHNTKMVNDELKEGGFYEALPMFFHEMCGSRGGFIKGPVIRIKPDMDWGPDGRTPTITRKARRCYYAPRGFDIFPGPGATSVDDGTLSERLPLTKRALFGLIGAPGFFEEAIRAVLQDFDNGVPLSGWYWEDAERERLESQSNNGLFKARKGKIDCIEHHTWMDGATLLRSGVPPQMVDDPGKVYPISVWMVSARRVIGVRINDDPMEKRPYFKAGFFEVPGSFWYDGIPELGEAYQRLCNAAARGLSNNMGMASGFFTEIQVDRLARGETVRKPAPYDVIQTAQARNGASGPAVFTHQAQLHAEAFMRIEMHYSSQLDEVLGLPSFLAGINETSGAGGTSSGLSQLRQMQSDQFSYATTLVDAAINGVASETHRDMLMTPDGTGADAKDPNSPHQLTGDMHFEARGVRSLSQQQSVQVRINELLVATNNPTDLAIMGPTGRAELLREAVKGIPNIDAARTVPPRDQMMLAERARMMMPQQPAGPDGAGGQAKGEDPPKGKSVDAAGTPAGAGNAMVAV